MYSVDCFAFFALFLSFVLPSVPFVFSLLGFNKASFNSVALSFKELNFSKLVAIFFRKFSFSNHIACVFFFVVTMYFVMYVFHDVLLLGTLRSNDADGKENVKKKQKTIGLISKTTTLHVHHTLFTFLSRFCATRGENA